MYFLGKHFQVRDPNGPNGFAVGTRLYLQPLFRQDPIDRLSLKRPQTIVRPRVSRQGPQQETNADPNPSHPPYYTAAGHKIRTHTPPVRQNVPDKGPWCL